MFERNKQPYLFKGFKQSETKTALQEHPEKQSNIGNKSLSASPNYHSSQFGVIQKHLMSSESRLLKTLAGRSNREGRH